jgi:hypothetical protein
MSSASELSAAPLFASLPAPAYRRQTFAPELPTTYDDGENVSRTGLPDYVCHQSRTFTFFEYKAGKLNRHLSQSSSHAALQSEYGIREQSHAFLSDHFWYNGYGSGKTICLNHAYNHSLFKVLALQALHGWAQYIVVFKTNPKPEDAQAYCEAGLVWCTEKTVHRLLASIDLCAHGVYYPFYLRTTKYSVIVQPTPDDPSLSPEQITASRRTAYEAVVAAYSAAAAARIAADAADEAAGILPF